MERRLSEDIVRISNAGGGLISQANDPGTIPKTALWLITFTIPVLLGIVNWIMVQVDSALIALRLEWTLGSIRSGGVAAGAVVFMALGSVLATGAAALVFFVAPICAGSGLPEAKGYLNGSTVPDMSEWKNFLVRVVGVTLAVSSSLPVGREGPMVCIGGALGIGVTWFFGQPHLNRWVEAQGRTSSMKSVLLKEDHFARAKRVGCVLGGAAGIACAFNAPVGAILYMFEEVTVSSWPPEVTFRVFVCTALAACASRTVIALSPMADAVERLLIYEHRDFGARGWAWQDMPVILVLGAAVGLYSAIFTHGLTAVWMLRKKLMTTTRGWRYFTYFRIWDVTLYSMLCALVMALVPMLVDCTRTTQPYLEGDAHSLHYVEYTCHHGEWNQVATLLLSNIEGAVKHLFSRNAEHFDLAPLAIALTVFSLLCVGTAGLLTPMGLFVPNMFIGGMAGRLVGEALYKSGWEGYAHPGVFALVGSAAMLGGFTHMTIAIVVLLIEAANDLSVVIPIMFATFVSHLVSTAASHLAFDERLIQKKRIPYLDSHLPRDIDGGTMTALDLCTVWPTEPEAWLPTHASVDEVHEALALERRHDFPVVDESDRLRGLVTRARLEHLLSVVEQRAASCGFNGIATSRDPTSTGTTEVSSSANGGRVRPARTYFQEIERVESPRNVDIGQYIHTGTLSDATTAAHDTPVPVGQIMDRSPYVVHSGLPLARVHTLFAEVGATGLCVVGDDGKLVGLISRTMVINATQKEGLRLVTVAAQSNLMASPMSLPSQSPFSSLALGTGARFRQRMSERLEKSQPRQHRLPLHVIWMITLFIPIGAGTANYVMILADAGMVGWKFESVQKVFSGHEDYGLALGTLALVCICCCFAGVAVCGVSFVAPICAGSGLPEAKGYLNGNYVADMFEPINLYVRIIGIIFAVAAGLPVGREGPMVCIGGCLGIGTVHVLAKKYVSSEAKLDARKDDPQHVQSSLFFIEEERFRHAKRMGCILGASAGIAAAFGAPVGGLLYMFEEVTVTSWPSELTFRVFVCTVVACLVSQGLLNITGRDVHRLILWKEEAEEATQWQWLDLPLFIVLAVVCGLCSALFTKGTVAVFGLRRRMHTSSIFNHRQPYPKLWDALLYAALCAAVFALVPSFFECRPMHEQLIMHLGAGNASSTGGHGSDHDVSLGSGHGSDVGHRRLNEEAGDGHTGGYVVYTCHEGEFNEVATLLLSGAEGAIKELYSRNQGEHLSLEGLACVFFVYSLLATGACGLSVPMGSFVPAMLMGAVLGRFVGEAAVSDHTSPAGVYALVGSAAMLSGFTRMTIAIVMLLVEATRDLSSLLPLMLSIFVAQCVSRLVARHDFLDEMLEKKGIAFLDPTLPPSMCGSNVTAGKLQSERPVELSINVPVTKVLEALTQTKVPIFPVVQESYCIGLVPRNRLVDAMWASMQNREWRSQTSEQSKEDERDGSKSSTTSPTQPGSVCRTSTLDRAIMIKNVLSTPKGRDNDSIVVSGFMDPAPYTVLSDMPLACFYRLFTKAGCGAVCIVSREGEYQGLLSRADLMAASHLARAQEHTGCCGSHARPPSELFQDSAEPHRRTGPKEKEISDASPPTFGRDGRHENPDGECSNGNGHGAPSPSPNGRSSRRGHATARSSVSTSGYALPEATPLGASLAELASPVSSGVSPSAVKLEVTGKKRAAGTKRVAFAGDRDGAPEPSAFGQSCLPRSVVGALIGVCQPASSQRICGQGT